MLIQEFCDATGLSRDTVRFYVKKGLLTPQVGAGPGGTTLPSASTRAAAHRVVRPSNRYQVFDAAQVERARLIRAAQGLGFTLAEIAKLAAAYDAGGLSRARKIALLRAHLEALDERAARLRAVRHYLTAKLRWLESGERGAPPPAPDELRAPPAPRRLGARAAAKR